MYINHNQMATQVSNTLASHYDNLSTSVERLSTGLRINSAADDAAGRNVRHRFDQARQRGLETAGDLPEGCDRRARFAALDLPEHGLADAGFLRRPVEAPAAFAAQCAQGAGKIVAGFRVVHDF